MSRVLRVFGESFDPTGFLQASELRPYEIARKGDPDIPESRNPDRWFWKVGGFKCDVSEDNWDDLRAQMHDALAFLKKYYRDLERLKSESAVEEKWLDFGYNCRLNPESVFMQGEYIPIELIKLAAELEIEIGLSLYPPNFLEWAEQAAQRAKPERGTSG